MFRTIAKVEPGTAAEQSAYDRWMDQTVDREQARIAQVQTEEGIISLAAVAGPLRALWRDLRVHAVFADIGERAVTQAMLMASVTVVITILMLLVIFFNHPHGGGVGRLQPTAIERTLRLIDAQLKVVELDVTPPCDERGVAR